MSVYVVIRRTFPKAFAGVVIALALPGSAWAQPASGDAPATMMLVPASPLVIGTPAFTPGELDIPAIGVSAVVTSVGTVMASAPFLGGQMVPTFAVPPDGSSVGWWADGPLVGAEFDDPLVADLSAETLERLVARIRAIAAAS